MSDLKLEWIENTNFTCPRLSANALEIFECSLAAFRYRPKENYIKWLAAWAGYHSKLSLSYSSLSDADTMVCCTNPASILFRTPFHGHAWLFQSRETSCNWKYSPSPPIIALVTTLIRRITKKRVGLHTFI